MLCYRVPDMRHGSSGNSRAILARVQCCHLTTLEHELPSPVHRDNFQLLDLSKSQQLARLTFVMSHTFEQT